MNFRTQVELPQKELEIGHSDQMMLFGSCFATNIGELLLTHKFRCDVNPLGILYNPASIAEAIRQILARTTYLDTDLFSNRGSWHSYMHHSSFSSASSADCLTGINRRLQEASAGLPQLNTLMITWGTAWVYWLKETGQVVGNCHKQSDKLFVRKLLTVDEIVQQYVSLIAQLHAVNPRLRILFTVSPIRHAKDGMHGNQISKSTLLLAIDAIRQQCENCFYFPSYEIMMDELRDYRFYDDDMLHPSRVAVSYLWECFCTTYFSAETKQIMKEWEEISKALNHKPFDRHAASYHTFLTQIVLKIHRLKEKFPYFDVQKELEQCQAQLKI